MTIKRSVIIFVIAASLTAGIFAGCAKGPVRLTEKDAGSVVELHMGDKLQVVLEGNPTTGYMWEVGSIDSAVIKPAGNPEFRRDSKAIGAGGKMTLSFEPVLAGRTTLKLIYHRPWEKSAVPAKTFKVTVVVK